MPAGARPNILLIGFMGSGKSSVGRLIASRTGYRFVDTDALVIQNTGSQIADLFREQGEPFFRDQESSALESLRNEDRCVIATGGGIILRPSNVTLLRELGFVVWLTASEDVIFERVSRNAKRPLIQTSDPRRTIHDLFDARSPLYAAAAHFTIDTSDKPHAAIADAILNETARTFA